MVIIDTNIIIDHLRQTTKPAEGTLLTRFIESHDFSETIAISVITIQELYQGQGTKKSAEEQKLLQVITPYAVLPYNYEVAELAGKIGRDGKSLLEFADAAIAATAILNGAELLSLNTKDFKNIKGLKLISFDKL